MKLFLSDFRLKMILNENSGSQLTEAVLCGGEMSNEMLTFRVSNHDTVHVSKSVFLSQSPLLREVVGSVGPSDRIVVIAPDIGHQTLETVERIFEMKWRTQSEIRFDQSVFDTLKMFGYCGNIEQVENVHGRTPSKPTKLKFKPERTIQSYFKKRLASKKAEKEAVDSGNSPSEIKMNGKEGKGSQGIIFKCVKCEYSTTGGEEGKPMRYSYVNKLRSHVLTHLKKEFDVQREFYFKDNTCQLCGVGIRGFSSNRNMHLVTVHDVLKNEVENILDQIKQNAKSSLNASGVETENAGKGENGKVIAENPEEGDNFPLEMITEEERSRIESPGVTYKCVRCEYSTTKEDGKKSVEFKLRSHVTIHFKKEFEHFRDLHFKDNVCNLCETSIRGTNTTKNMHLVSLHDILRPEIENVLSQIKENSVFSIPLAKNEKGKLEDIEKSAEKIKEEVESEADINLKIVAVESVAQNCHPLEGCDSTAAPDEAANSNDSIHKLLLLEQSFDDNSSSDEDCDEDDHDMSEEEEDFNDVDDMNGNSSDTSFLQKKILEANTAIMSDNDTF